jgi:hypothetical protein
MGHPQVGRADLGPTSACLAAFIYEGFRALQGKGVSAGPPRPTAERGYQWPLPARPRSTGVSPSPTCADQPRRGRDLGGNASAWRPPDSEEEDAADAQVLR